jgi:acyl-CoA hydrolase/RimJ/RimL family protein N-acetyltransferase
MSWQETYAQRLATPERAVRAIPPGRRILIGSGAAEPLALVEALVEHGDHLADNEVVHLLTLGPAPYVRPDLQHRFRHTAFFIGANVREAVHDGRADFMPVFLSDLPELIRSRRVPIDVALVQVAPPDRHGFVSLGVSVDIVRAAVETATLVIAEVNPRMPRTLGDSFVPVRRIDHLVPVDTPLPERAPSELDETAREIGRHVASLVPDGATLQVGIGSIPDAVLAALAGRRDLGIHTEMLSDGVMALAEAGVITGRKKTLLPGKMVTSFVMGSTKLYAWADDNPAIEMRPSDFTNDPVNIARNDRMVAINGALSVDLTGQVASDTLGGRFYSGIGGQVDFVRGAARSRGGRPIIALRSTAVAGATSRIVPVFEAGAGVVTSRGDVHYVVTEFGIADLWGKSIRERAMALVSIAHPDHRGELLAVAKERRYVFPDQVVPRAVDPSAQAGIERLEVSGAEVEVRPLRVTDERQLQDLLYRLSDESVHQRFLAYKQYHPHAEVQKLVDLDFETSAGLVVALPGSAEILGTACYFVDRATRLADIAFVVRDDWQGRGVGTLLLRRLTDIARAHGLAGFSADVLASNHRMMNVFHESGLKLRTRLQAGVYHVEAHFEEEAPAEAGPAAAR